MKSFQAVILAAIVASSTAINEPVASPTAVLFAAAVESELTEYERQLLQKENGSSRQLREGSISMSVSLAPSVKSTPAPVFNPTNPPITPFPTEPAPATPAPITPFPTEPTVPETPEPTPFPTPAGSELDPPTLAPTEVSLFNE